MNYKTFANPEELPKGEATVISGIEDENDAILIAKYRDGVAIAEPKYMSVIDVDVTVKDIIGDSSKVYVHEEAESTFQWMVEYAKIHERCNGNLEKIAEAMDECIEAHAMYFDAEYLD